MLAWRARLGARPNALGFLLSYGRGGFVFLFAGFLLAAAICVAIGEGMGQDIACLALKDGHFFGELAAIFRGEALVAEITQTFFDDAIKFRGASFAALRGFAALGFLQLSVSVQNGSAFCLTRIHIIVSFLKMC